MKMILSVAILFFGLAVQADGGFPGLSKITGAQMSCANKRAAYAINFKDKRVWQTDPGADDGIELSNVTITPLRCMNCYDISGSISDVPVSLVIQSQPDQSLLGKLIVSKGSKNELTLALSCSLTKQFTNKRF